MNDNAFGRTANVVVDGEVWEVLGDNNNWYEVLSIQGGSVIDIAYDQARNDLWALTDDGDVLRRTEGNWEDCSNGLESSDFNDLVIDGGGKYAHLGGDDGSIWHLNIQNAIDAGDCQPE